MKLIKSFKIRRLEKAIKNLRIEIDSLTKMLTTYSSNDTDLTEVLFEKKCKLDDKIIELYELKAHTKGKNHE
jgi:hypothetical protein